MSVQILWCGINIDVYTKNHVNIIGTEIAYELIYSASFLRFRTKSKKYIVEHTVDNPLYDAVNDSNENNGTDKGKTSIKNAKEDIVRPGNSGIFCNKAFDKSETEL